MSKSKIKYEWISKELVVDEYGDLVNICTDGHKTFQEAMDMAICKNDFLENGSVVLVKYYLEGCFGDIIEASTESEWCANSLDISDEFDDGSDVPKYLKKQIINEVKTWGLEEE
jgi:hypothetical protein